MITSKQVAALRFIIFKSREGTDLTKRILAYLIDQSHGLTKEVCLTLIEGRDGFAYDDIDQAARSLGPMQSLGGALHLPEIMKAMNCGMIFSVHYGDFDPSADEVVSTIGMFPTDNLRLIADPAQGLRNVRLRYTFWLARGCYSETAALVRVHKDELDQIDLTKPGLYPGHER